MWLRSVFGFLGLLAVNSASAQLFDPRITLGQLIQAFQNCGPPVVYQMLSPQLFQIVAAQTGGSGCYAQIRAAGPVQTMQVIDQKVLPNGSVYAIRVFHTAGPVDWFMGISQLTGKVELLTFQAAQTSAPSVATGPIAGAGGSAGGGNPTPTTPPSKPSGGKSGDGCDLYPSMCK